MSSRPSGRSLASRLTFWYSGIFTASTVVTYALVYVMLSAILDDNGRAEVEEDLLELDALYAAGGEAALWEELGDEVESEGENQVSVRLYDRELKPIDSTDLPYWDQLPAPDTELPLHGIHSRIANGVIDDSPAAVGLVRIADDRYLQLGINLEANVEFLDALQTIFLASLPFMLGCAAAVGWLLARKALQGVQAVTVTARAISQGRLDERVPRSDHGEEVNQLADAFNLMAERINLLLRGMHEITDNIAHDLRSPVTRIRGQAEAILTSAETADIDTCRAALALTIEESDRLIGMINTMLDITETEAGLMQEGAAPVDVSILVREACDLFQPLAARQQVDLELLAEDGISIRGNASFLQRLVANLVDNALKYTAPGGKVSITLQQLSYSIQLKVEDTGIGIDARDIDKIFSRFYRCDNSRSKPGNGLGLALARAIARAHRGDIEVRSEIARGSIFTVVLPVSA